MAVIVNLVAGAHHLAGDWVGIEEANRFLAHLAARAFSPATSRAYAFDVANLARFLDEHGLDLATVEAVDVYAWVDWQGAHPSGSGSTVVRLRARTAAPATINRRVAAVRAFFELLVMSGAREANPVPVPRRGQGLRLASRGMLGHLGPGRPRGGGRLVPEQRRLPESLDLADVQAFLAAWAATGIGRWCWRCCSADCARPRFAACCSPTWTRAGATCGWSARAAESAFVPVDPAFFAELAAYLRHERPPRLGTPQCFVVLRGPSTGAPVSEAGLRSLFRQHRLSSGAVRVRPHRLRHTYGTELTN